MAQHEALKQAVISGRMAQVKELTQQALDAGANPQEVLDQGLIPAMDLVGQKFSCQEFFIPEMLIAARAMQAGIAILKPRLAAQGGKPRGTVVIGTVQGDLHDIGKNLVGLMLQGGGFEVVDLGADVKPERFVGAVTTSQPQFVMMSALLTTTMLSMKATIEQLEVAGVRSQVKVGVGGAPVTQRFCDEIGADFYAADATGAVGQAKALLSAQKCYERYGARRGDADHGRADHEPPRRTARLPASGTGGHDPRHREPDDHNDAARIPRRGVSVLGRIACPRSAPPASALVPHHAAYYRRVSHLGTLGVPRRPQRRRNARCLK